MQMTQTSSPEEKLAALGSRSQPACAGRQLRSGKRVGAIVYLSGVISTGPGGVITEPPASIAHRRRIHRCIRLWRLTQLAVLKR